MSIFDPNSKFMYYLGITGDLIIVNFLFVVCSLPVFTIGATQTGLYTALRNILDRDTKSTPAKSFFKGFKNGFSKITVFWLFFAVIIALLCYSVYFIYFNKLDAKVPAIIALVGIVILLMIFSQLSMFHSRFDCEKGQLLRNAIIMTFAFPLRSILIAALTWLPAILILINDYLFIWATPLWFGIYFSFAFETNSILMKKAYEKIINQDA